MITLSALLPLQHYTEPVAVKDTFFFIFLFFFQLHEQLNSTTPPLPNPGHYSDILKKRANKNVEHQYQTNKLICLAIMARHAWDVDGNDRSPVSGIASAGSFCTGMYRFSTNLVTTSKFQVLAKGDMRQVTY